MSAPTGAAPGAQVGRSKGEAEEAPLLVARPGSARGLTGWPCAAAAGGLFAAAGAAAAALIWWTSSRPPLHHGPPPLAHDHVVSAHAPAQVDRRPMRGFAIAFQGGGFRSTSCFTGMVAGLAARLPAGHEDDRTGELLRPFSIVASNNGGTWFAAELMYSRSFSALLGTIAGSSTVQQANRTYMDRWLSPLLREMNISAALQGRVYRDCVSAVQAFASYLVVDAAKEADEVCAYWAMSKASTLRTHREFAAVVLNSTGGISASVPLNSRSVNRWAVGKTWSIAASTPSGNLDRFTTLVAHNEQGPLRRDKRSVSYIASGSHAINLPPTLAVQFSVVVGRGGASAPLPFCLRKDCGNVSLTYTVDAGCEEYACLRFATSRPLAELVRPLTAELGELPLLSAAASSSAIEGLQVLVTHALWNGRPPPEWEALQLVHPFVTPVFYSVGLPGAPWQTPIQVDLLVEQDLSKNPLVAFMDGGRSDNTGIVHAVAAGATTVVALMGGQAADVWNLFTCRPDTLYTPKGDPNCLQEMPICGLYFPIFRSPSCSWDAARAFEAGATWIKAAANSTVIRGVQFFKFHVTTQDNPWVGVQGGRSVELRMVLVQGLAEGDLPIGTATNWGMFGSMAAELFGALALEEGNAAAVQELLRYFVPP